MPKSTVLQQEFCGEEKCFEFLTQLSMLSILSLELGELSQWLSHDDSTTNVISVTIITINALSKTNN